MILTRLSDTYIRQKENSIYDAAYDILMNYGIEISVIIKNMEQYEYWLGSLPFYTNIQKEGIVIDGS